MDATRSSTLSHFHRQKNYDVSAVGLTGQDSDVRVFLSCESALVTGILRLDEFFRINVEVRGKDDFVVHDRPASGCTETERPKRRGPLIDRS